MAGEFAHASVPVGRAGDHVLCVCVCPVVLARYACFSTGYLPSSLREPGAVLKDVCKRHLFFKTVSEVMGGMPTA